MILIMSKDIKLHIETIEVRTKHHSRDHLANDVESPNI